MSVRAPLPHDSGPLHVTGKARYIDDISTPKGTLHLAFGTSSIASGRIAAMNLEKVKSAPGVIAVLTARDLPRGVDVSPSAHDEPLLSDGTVHFVGQPIFLVIAKTHLAARTAAKLGDISYDEATPILTIEAALAANSRFEDGPRVYSKGDTNAAIAASPRRVEGTLEIGGQEHFYLEGQAALAFPQEDGAMLVHSSTQHPSEIQHKVADALGVGMHAVRVEIRRMGGGFGGKESQGNALAVACALAAQMTEKPCKMRYDRDDDMTITGKRHDFRIKYRAGFDDTGVLTGVEFIQYARCGWSLDLSIPVADRAMLSADNAYHLPTARIESHRLKTNTQSATAYRGFGGPQGIIGIERVMDHIAFDLGIDPVAVRQNNFYASGGTKKETTPYGMVVEDSISTELTDALLASSNYAARRGAIADWNEKNPVLKKGIGFSPVKFGISFTLTHLNQAGALVHVYQDGTIHLNHGGTEMGQGLFQKLAQVAAARFGVDTNVIKITATDTDKVPNTSATAASSGSDLNGMAVKAACDTIRGRMAEFLASDNDCAVTDVQFGEDKVTVGDRVMGFCEAAKICYENRISLSSTGFYKTPKVSWDRIKGSGRPFFYFSYGVAITEVVIDTLTGENRILRTDILHDVGASLNPALDVGQIEGAYVQGAGWLTTEELVWDDKGALRTHAPSTYKIPACGDRPDIFNVDLWDGENREETIYRSKAVGEPPFCHGISAFLALSDAISATGNIYPALDAPATAETILKAVTRVKNGI